MFQDYPDLVLTSTGPPNFHLLMEFYEGKINKLEDFFLQSSPCFVL